MNCDQVRDLAAAYVLGALERDEEQAVRDHVATCPAVHEELAQLAGVVPYLAETVEPAEPPESLKARILAAAAQDLEERRAAGPAPRAGVTSRGEIVPIRRPATTTWALRIAAVLVIGVLGAWNLSLQQRYDEADEFRQAVVAVLETARQPGSQAAILAAPDGTGPAGLAAVSADGSVQLALHGLQPTTGTQVYTAWMIVGDATPVPVGGFTVGADGVAMFRTQPGPVAPGVVVAVSLEPAPGSTTPLGPIVSVGVASAPPA